MSPTRHRRLPAVLTTLLVAAIGAPAATAASPAEAPTVAQVPNAAECYGEVVDARVQGDLVVTGACHLRRVVVTGDLDIRPGAELRVHRSGVQGDVRVAQGSSARLQASTVWGGVSATDATSVVIDNATIHRSVRGQLHELSVRRADVHGAVNVAVAGGGVDLVAAEVHGWVNVHRGTVRVTDSRLHRGLTVSAASLRLCATTVDGDVTARWSHAPVEIGTNLNPRWSCDPSSEAGSPATVVGGSVHIIDNHHSVAVAETTVAGNLTCSGNDGGRYGVRVDDATVSVAGARTGQCA